MKKQIAVWTFVLFSTNSACAMDISSADVERFIKTYEVLLPYVDLYDDDEGEGDDILNEFDPRALKQQFLNVLSADSRTLNIIRKNGYASAEPFAEKAAYIVRAYVAHTAAEGLKIFEQAVAKMSPDERQALESTPMFQQFKELRATLSTIPASHLHVLKPRLAQLNDLFQDPDDDD